MSSPGAADLAGGSDGTNGAEVAAEQAPGRALADLARQIARRELLPAAGRLDISDAETIGACWRVMCDVGLDRALRSESEGGAGIGALDLLAVIEELAVGDAGIALAVLLANVAFVAMPSARAATLPPGARWAAVPVGWGAQLTIRQGRLEEISTLAFGAHGAHGLVFVLPASPGDDRSRCSVLCAQGSTPHLRREREEHQLGLSGAPAAMVAFSVADAQLRSGSSLDPWSGEQRRGGGCEAELCLFDLMRRGAAAIARGIARRAEQLALEYAQQRRQGGVAIVAHDAVRDMLGAMAVRRILRPAERIAEADARAFAIAEKILATDAALASATDAVQVFGGTGYMVETGVEKLMRDAQYCTLFPEPAWQASQELIALARSTT